MNIFLVFFSINLLSDRLCAQECDSTLILENNDYITNSKDSSFSGISNSNRNKELLEYLDWEKRFGTGLEVLNATPIKGNISMSYQNGIPTDLFMSRSPFTNARMSANVSTEISKIPVNIRSAYSLQPINPETENFFRVSFDKQAIRDKELKAQQAKLKSIAEQRNLLTKEKTELSKKLSFLNTGLSSPTVAEAKIVAGNLQNDSGISKYENFAHLSQDSIPNLSNSNNIGNHCLFNFNEEKISDANKEEFGNLDSSFTDQIDSIKIQNSTLENLDDSTFCVIDSVKFAETNLDFNSTPDVGESESGLLLTKGMETPKEFTSVKLKDASENKGDKLLELVETDVLKLKRDSLNRQIKNLEDKIQSLDKYKKSVESPDSLINLQKKKLGIQKALDKVEKFQIGQTNPNFSHFILGSVMLNGVYLQYDQKEKERHFLHGQVIAPQFFNIQQRQIWMQNLLSDFIPVFANVGDRVSAVQIQLSKSSKLDSRITGMYGLDRNTNLSSASTSSRNKLSGFSTNGVGEFGLKKNLNESVVFEMAYTVSSIVNKSQDEVQSSDQEFQGKIGHAVWTSLKKQFKKPLIDLKIEGSLVDKNFMSIGNPYLRSGQVQIGGEIKKRWKKSLLKISSKYYGSDYLSKINFRQSALAMICQGQVRIKKSLQIIGIYSPIFIKSIYPESSKFDKSRLDQYNLNATWIIPRTGSTQSINFNSSIMTFYSLKEKVLTEDYSCTWAWTLSEKLSSSSTVRYGDSNIPNDSIVNRNYSVEENIIYQVTKSLGMDCGLRMLNNGAKNDLGWKFGASYNFKQRLVMSTYYQKVVLESFYQEQLNRLNIDAPYRFFIEFNYLLK